MSARLQSHATIVICSNTAKTVSDIDAVLSKLSYLQQIVQTPLKLPTFSPITG